MKVIRFIIIAFVLFISTIIVISGCKYDVAEPPWDTTQYIPPDTIPAINSITPTQAVPGTNLITILGENFDLVPDTKIWLEYPVGSAYPTIVPEVTEKTQTSITIRRPDLVTDSCYVKVTPHSGEVVKFGPYKIDPVLEEWGAFLENQPLQVLAADNAENLYVVQGSSSPYTIVKITAAEERSIFLDTLPPLPPNVTNAPTDAVVGPDGNLYLLRNNKQIQKVNLSSGDISVWYSFSSAKSLRFGDFDADGYFYTGGPRTDLCIITQDSTSSVSGMYSTAAGGDTIWNVKVYGNQVYVAAGGASGLAIYRHSIVSGTVVDKTLVLNLTARFGYRPIESIEVSSDGKIFIGTDAPADPILVYDQASDNLDYFYKNILPPYCKAFCWGTGDYFYMISGKSATTTDPTTQTWDCFRVDAGITTAQ